MQIENLRFNTLKSKDLAFKSGIYKLSSGGHIYIGSSKNLYSRLAEHRTDLKYNRHTNRFLQNVYNQTDIDNFRIDIIEFCAPEKRIEKEAFWIKELNADMNCQDPVSHELSEESKKKLSESIRKGLKEGKYKKKFDKCEIEAYDYFGNFVQKFESKEAAAKAYNLSIKEVQNLAGGYKKGKVQNGIRFRYAVSKVPVQTFSPNPQFIGNHYVFYYIDENDEEKFAFSSVKNCWAFLAQHVSDREIKIIPKLRFQTKERNTGKRKK